MAYLHLRFREVERRRQIEPFVADHVLLLVELQLQPFELFGSEDRSDTFGFVLVTETVPSGGEMLIGRQTVR